MKMARFPWTNKGKLYWHEDNYYLTVTPEKNKLRIGRIDVLELHKRWGLAGLRGPFMVVTNIRERLMGVITPSTLLNELFEDSQQKQPSLTRPRF
ncbi:MAG: hypothetical protein ACXADB_13095 [Candidatus Hermodarchaeia archaeon]|jgi:hypothetical protein